MLAVWERKVLRKIYGPHFENGQFRSRTNKELMELYGEPSIVSFIKKGRLRWLGHLERMPEGRLPKRALYGHPGGLRKRGRPRLRRLQDVEDDLRRDPTIARDIAFIKSHYVFLVPIINPLESSGKLVYTQLGLIEEVTEKINLVPGYVGEKVSEKLKSLLQKNPGLTVVRIVADILAGKAPQHECAVPVHLIPTFKYALVSSVDVERSFSAYKMVLSEKRCSFSMENLEKVLVVYSGSNYGHVQ
ncbi:hypothetical protein ANN_12096 [Periplaneta americana]|uniref:DUF659 domain-containing protein n=1 Tax=Periplaneta americana TaxID=6978 RepID=A0ABQ8T968_PERAM|nr:hypothetical protein ANN_12096 [Periplaneta americana]